MKYTIISTFVSLFLGIIVHAQLKEIILTENFNYANINDFAQKNAPNLSKSKWSMANKWQYTPNILGNKPYDIRSINNESAKTYSPVPLRKGNNGAKRLSSLGTLSGLDFINIINNVKQSEIVRINNENWLALSYKTPILSPIDLLTLRNIINNSFNAGQKLQQNYKVYFTRNEIYTAKQQTKIYPEKDYWVGWTVIVDKNFSFQNNCHTIIGQFHANDNYKYFLKNKKNGGVPPLVVYAVMIDGKKYWQIKGTLINAKNHNYLIKNIPLVPGQQYEFKFHVRFSPDKKGIIETWVNGKQIVNLKNITTHLKQLPTGSNKMTPFKFAYFKIGQYNPQWAKMSQMAWKQHHYTYSNYSTLKFITKKIFVTDIWMKTTE